MKKFFFLLGLPMALLASGLSELINAETINGTLTAEKTQRLLFQDDFSKGSGQWEITNYRNRLTFQTEMLHGKNCLTVRNHNRELPKGERIWDTAFEIISEKFPLDSAEIVTVECGTCSNLHMKSASGSRQSHQYASRLEFFFEDGKSAGTVPLYFGSAPNVFFRDCQQSLVPMGAAFVRLILGTDNKNLQPDNDFIAYTGIRLGAIDADAPYPPSSQAISLPLPFRSGEQITWEAECPPGTSIAFQLSMAPDNQGIPGAWSDFQGPDGTSASKYSKSGERLKTSDNAEWFRWKAFLTSTAKAAPVLKSVTIGTRTDSKWFHGDTAPAPEMWRTSLSPTENATAPVSFKFIAQAEVAAASIQVKIDGQDVSKELIRKNDEFFYQPDIPFSPGLHEISVKASFLDGTQVNEPDYFFIGKAPKQNVVVREDGMTEVNGKPFFAIGFWTFSLEAFNDFDYEKGFRDLQESGFNCVHEYSRAPSQPDVFPKYAALAEKYGIKLIMSAGSKGSEYEKSARSILHRMNAPAVIAWNIGDDTSGNNTAASMRCRARAIRAVDPIHILTHADGFMAGKSIPYPFNQYCDNFQIELYPIRQGDPKNAEKCVATVIASIKNCIANDIRVNGHAKSYWPLIQYFKGRSWHRYPTLNELRAMTYATIIHGANGILWYRYRSDERYSGATFTPEHWETLSKVAKELRELSEILVNGKKVSAEVEILSGPLLDYYDHPSVTALAKEFNGKTYLFTVNATDQEVKVKIGQPGMKSAKTLFEDGRVPVFRNNALEEIFAPQAAHVYELE